MAKELYLYQPIYSYTAETLISKLEENSREDITLRINSPGGSIFAGWGIAAKMAEKSNGKITAKVDGMAASMTAVLLLYADKVIASDTSAIMIHRGDGPVNSAADQAFLDKANKDLRGKMEKRIDSDKLKTMKGYSIDELFTASERVDIWLTAKEAKALGLVDEIVKVNPKDIEAIAVKAMAEASTAGRYGIAAENPIIPTPTPMTIEKLKAEHPEVYAKILALGAANEKDRVQAWAHFAQVDPEAVKKGIESGEVISQVQMIEFMEKKLNAKALGDLKGETGKNADAGKTGGAEADAGKKAAETKAEEKKEFFNNVNSYTGVKIFQ